MQFKDTFGKASRFLLKSALKTTVITLAVLMVWAAYVGLDTWKERKDLEPVVVGDESDLNTSHLASRIIDMEVEAGIATEPEKARRILAGLIEESKNIEPPAEPTTMSMRAYLSAIGQLVDRHYYYRRSTTFTEGLIAGGLDCDLRAIVYQTIAAEAGIDTGIVYSPGHAFLGWQAEESGVSLYWETTVRNGQVAVLSNKSTYRDSDDPADYKILSQAQSEALYASWLYSEAFDRNGDPVHLAKVLEYADAHPSWHYPQVAKLYTLYNAYGIEDQLTKDQLQVYVNLNGNDDYGKRLLMQHYKAKGENDKALDVFSKLTEYAREPEDFDLASQVVSSPARWVKYQAIAKTYEGLQSFKSNTYHKKFDWWEYVLMLMSIMTFSLSWIVLPYVFKLMKWKPKMEATA